MTPNEARLKADALIAAYIPGRPMDEKAALVKYLHDGIVGEEEYRLVLGETLTTLAALLLRHGDMLDVDPLEYWEGFVEQRGQGW